MQIKVTFKEYKMDDEQIEVTNKFIRFLQEKFPLEDPIQIIFSGVRYGKMTTGSRTENDILKILASGRLMVDILRTLAHEWVHEYQHQVLHWEIGPDIGGKNENHANIEAGILMKQFQMKYKNFESVLYNGIMTDRELKFS
jgi:hypothetical protein